MGFFGTSDENGPRTKLLRSLSLPQLKQLAKDHGVSLTSNSLFGTSAASSRSDIIERLTEAEDELPIKAIRAFKSKIEGRKDDEPTPPRSATGKASKSATPPKQSARTQEVAQFIREYDFLKRYGNEKEYQAELGGALNARFEKVRREFPVPVAGRGLVIDVDVGGGMDGVGIEIKANVKDANILRNASAQIDAYKEHYSDRLIFVLIGTTGLQPEKHDIQAKGIVFIQKG